MPYDPPVYRSGDSLAADELNRANAEIKRLGDSRGSAGILVRQGSGGVQYAVINDTDYHDGIYIRITGSPDGNGGYPWVEVYPDTLGTWAISTRVGNVANQDPAYELNHRLDIPTDSVVYLARRAVTTAEWLFRSRRSCS